MKQTREFTISLKIVTSTDLRRLGEVFQRQQTLAKKSEYHSSMKYDVRFSDETGIESDSTEVLDDGALTGFPSRPIAVRMTFFNFSLSRSVSLSLTHGESTHNNSVAVGGSESAWVTETFDALRRIIDGMHPQESRVRNHSRTIVLLFATSYACLIRLFTDALRPVIVSGFGVPTIPDSLRFLGSLPSWFDYVLNGFAGLFLGEVLLRARILRMWPSIEFQFGLRHLLEEQRKRSIVVPGIQTKQ